MAERYPRPATADNVGWNTTPTNPSTDPGSSLRAAGWATDAVPGSDEFNYLQTLWGNFLQWLEGTNGRTWDELSEGIAASVAKDLIWVVPPLVVDYTLERLSAKFSTTGTAATGGNIQQLCTDAEQLYYISGSTSQSLIGAACADLAEVFENTTNVTQASAICCDGDFVYLSCNATNPGIQQRNRTTGALIASEAGGRYGWARIATNGAYIAAINGSVGGGYIQFASCPTPVWLAEVNPDSTAFLEGLAVDADNCYVGGTRAGGNDVWAYKLSDQSQAWATPLDTNAPSVNCIAADGNFVYVGTDNFAIAAGGNRCIFCIDRITGTVMWSIDVGDDIDQIAVDQNYLYAVSIGEEIFGWKLHSLGHAGDKGPGFIRFKSNVDSAVPIVCDGETVYCRDQASPTKLRALFAGGPMTAYMRADGSDVQRRPFHTLAIPLTTG